MAQPSALTAADIDAVGDPTARRAALLQSAAMTALATNPIDLPPWTVPPAYANSATYTVGQVITGANGNWYECIIAGTSAASGTGPSATTAVSPIADGAAYFSYLSGPMLSANDPNAPTVVTTTTAPADLTRTYSLTAATTPVSLRGVTNIAVGGGGTTAVPSTFTDGTGALVSGGVGFGFETDSASVAFCFNQGQVPYRVIIDGRYYSIGAAPLLPNAGLTWVRYNFAGRKPRTFVIESGFSGNATAAVFGTSSGSIRIDTKSMLTPLSQPIKMVAISDSLFRGSDQGPMIPGNQTALQVGKLLGITDVYNLSIGGTGWLARGTSGSTTGTQSTFRERIAQGLAINPDLWLIGGSVNDIGLPTASITSEVTATIQAIRAGGSTAPIIVFGLLAAFYAGANGAPIEAAILAGITAAGDAQAYWVPVVNDPLGPWTDSNNNLMTATSGPHGPDYTLTYWAKRLASAIRRTVYPKAAM